jgi:hypothetical protein
VRIIAHAPTIVAVRRAVDRLAAASAVSAAGENLAAPRRRDVRPPTESEQQCGIYFPKEAYFMDTSNKEMH